MHHRPPFPQIGVVVRFLQCAQVSVGPCHLIAVTLIVTGLFLAGAEDGGYILGHIRFLRDTDDHQADWLLAARGLLTCGRHNFAFGGVESESCCLGKFALEGEVKLNHLHRGVVELE